MPNPWADLPYPWLAVLVAAALAGGVFLAMNPSLGPLRTQAAPKGIASLELAPDAARAGRVIDSWRRAGALDHARRVIALDCLFIPAYATLLALLWFAAAHALRARLPGVSAFVAAWGWAMWGAGLLDYVENFCDLRMIDHGASDLLARVSATCAAVKFVVTVVAVKVLF